MDLVVKRVILGEGRRMYGVCQVVERHGATLTAWELLHLQDGEPWAFTNTYWADKKRRAFDGWEAADLRRAGIEVPEPVIE